MDSRGALVPYFLAALAAVTWAIYSALLARWKAWAGNYVTSPLGFLLIGLFAMLRLATKDEPGPSGVAALWPTLLYGIGPLGAGYLLWELALPRASVQALSVMAAATPILSTALLCVVLKQVPGLALIMAAVLVSAAVVYCVKLPEDNATQADQGA